MREHPDANVIGWFEQNMQSAMSVSAVAQAETLTGIALASGLTVATRDRKDFEKIDGLTLANPWSGTWRN